MKSLRKVLAKAVKASIGALWATNGPEAELEEAKAGSDGSDKYTFEYAVENIPRGDKIESGGDDAWVTQSDLLVVADGVGGWAQHGYSSGRYSKKLCKNI